MAFFDEEIDKLSKRYPPKSIQDCLRTDNLSQTLWEWAQNIENWGRVVCLILVVCGLFVMMTTGVSKYDELEYVDNGGLLNIVCIMLYPSLWVPWPVLYRTIGFPPTLHCTMLPSVQAEQ